MYLSAIILGLLGNFHCMGMCGPITLILPLHQYNMPKKILAVSMYNLGRIFTYALIGLVFGSIGHAIVMTKIHQQVSITMGVIMIISVITPFLLSKKLKGRLNNSRFMNWLRGNIKSLLKTQNFAGYFLLGAMNGLLPCGLVYVAVAGAVISGSLAGGIIYMALFGLGTVPIMMLLPLFGQVLSKKLKINTSFIMPVATTIVGILFIVRGLGLDIPYVSPHKDTMTIGTEEPTEDGKVAPPKKSCH